ncbi:MAG: TIGR02444 family protein [Pseudomonadota bacterium]
MSAETFWNWSVRIYKTPELAPLLEQLQDDYALDVNLILWCAWAGDCGVILPSLSIRKAYDISQRWAAEVSGPLRTARRALKTPPRQAEPEAAAALRENVKAMELEAERIQQNILEALAEDAEPVRELEPKTAARRNLAEYAALARVTEKPGFSTSDLQKTLDLIYPG